MGKYIGAKAFPDSSGLVPLDSATASSSATISFDIPTGYASVEWHFYNMHPATDNVTFGFQVNATDGADFNDSQIQSNYFRAKHHESGTTGLDYIADFDQANGTAYQVLPNEVGNDNDQSTSGVLTLFDPASTTYMKHFTARFNDAHPSDITMDCWIAGYINDTTALDEISFKFSSGNIDDGTIVMYGVT
tara:strand:- start:54 stop:623 length:570 start_codon:yes stop_codon:yes gene_type:complete